MMKQVRLFLGLWVMGIGVWLWTGWPVAASESQPVEKKVLWGKGCSLVAQGAELGEASCRYGYDNLGRDVVEVEGEGGGLEEEMKIWLGIEVAYGAGDWDEVARLWGRLSPRGRVTPSAELLGRELWWRANGARRAAAPLPVRSEREWVAYMTTLEAEAAAQDMVVASEVAQVRRLGLWHDEVGWQEVEGAEGALGRSQGLTTTLTVGDGCQYNNLQLAINGANSGDDIWVGRPVGGGAWTGAAATANIDGKTLTIIGGYNVGCTSRTGYTTLNANGVTDTVLEMGTTSGVGTDEVRLRNFNLINAEGDIDFGGGLQIESGYTVILDDTWVYGNTADKGGGAYIDNGYLILQNNSRLHSNTAAGNGGGVFCTGGGTVRLRTGSDIGGAMGDGNIAGGSGGGIAADNCNVYIGDGSAGVSVSYNEGGFGGGIYGINGSQIILQYQPTLVGNNTGRTAGGGFYLSSGSKLYVDSGRIVQNVASSSGGGIYGTGVGTLIDFDLGTVGTHCVTPANQCLLLEQNQATNTYGGGFYLGSGATADIEAAYIQQNIGGIAASAFYATGSGTVINMRSSMIIDNYFLSQQEYVIRLFSGAEANLSGTTIAGNWNLAGAILGVASTFNGNGLIIYSNTATGLVNGTATINNSFLQYAHAGTNNQQTSPNLGILYHLPYYSPAVDYYNDTIMVDIDGESRPVSSLHDAGADEITPRVGVDGAACAYGTVGSALAAASDGSTVYISAGFYDERIGSINKDIHFVAATADCTGADSGATSSSVVIDANHQSALYGGVAELTTGRSVTFTNISLRDGEASYGGVLYIPTGSRVLLDDSDVSQGVATVV
ncbi:MAG TPA: hypothetical protein VLL52_20525, partial [Anaerolineae bacterium]|nr:hypothetical protein [Anaerolineae bacterium]